MGRGPTIAVVDGPGRIPLPEEHAPGFDALPPAAMVTQHEAARYLGVSPGKVGWLVFRTHLEGSRHGVTAGSLRRENNGAPPRHPARKPGAFWQMPCGHSSTGSEATHAA